MNPPPKVDLSRYSPGDYQPGPLALRVLWYVASIVFIETWIPWPATFKAGVLRFFGAKVGAGVVLKLQCKHSRDVYDKSGDRWMQ